MLRLKQIDLHGFKSFCNRERLRFSGRGIAAVVGPNGCGKSNICDAVNWVLGEQSAKSLRGSRMHDVIFGGTRNRAPAGLATVTLTLQDSGGVLQELRDRAAGAGPVRLPASAPNGEISVTRKLFANGDSHYILNGNVVRLRDVQELFLGTGLGPHHYAIIEQGRIGQLLTARSADRRAFLDEAAGVTRFKVRRRLAELKLANAGFNLERVHDILQEVQRQTASLKRQAEKTERYERYKGQLRDALGLLLANRFRHADGERERLESEFEAAAAAVREAQATVATLDSEFSEARSHEHELEAQLESERDELSGLRVDEERMRERVDQQTSALTANVGRIERAQADLKAASARVASLRERDRDERASIAALDGDMADLRARLSTQESERAGLEAAAAEQRAAQEDCRQEVLGALSKVSAAKAELERLDEILDGQQRRLERLRERAGADKDRLAEASNRRERLACEAAELKENAAREGARCEALRTAVDRRSGKLAELRKAVHDGAADVSRLASRRDSLREMLDHRAYATGAVKDILEALEANSRKGLHPLGMLADFVDVDVGYEKAVEQFLGEDLEHVVVTDWSQAAEGVQLVRDEIGARVAFFVRPMSSEAEGAPPEAIEGAVPLTTHVRLAVREGGWCAASLPKLRDGYLVDSAAVAERLAPQHPDRCFVLPDGTWYRANTVQAGRKSSSGPLVLKQQLRELSPQIDRADWALAELERDLRANETALRTDSEQLDASRARHQQLEKDLVAVERDSLQADRQVRELGGTIAEADAERSRVELERVQAADRRQDRIVAVKRFESEYGEREAWLAKLAASVREGEAVLAASQEACAALRTELATLEERHRSRVKALHEIEGRESEQLRILEDTRRQISAWRDDNVRLEANNADLKERIKAANARQGELHTEIEETADTLRDLRLRTAELIDEIRERRDLVEQSRKSRTSLEVRLARVQSDLEHLVETCSAEMGEGIEQVAERAPADPSPEALRDAEECYQTIKEKIDRLGPVNVLAREEFQRVAQRRDFLETQERDLLDAIRNARQAIQEIEVATRERFQSAFEAINRQFRQAFSLLFGGGVGEMRLSEPDNKGESGIDIVAQPPGKRLQNVALLSGGEKSLTVMALLMATFRYKPSPFCILDEVDSQLDETNTVRLRRLIQEMASETQFILITHSKTTMEVAETLYGVTMGEAGVSKLVSVRMHKAASSTAFAESSEVPLAAVGA